MGSVGNRGEDTTQYWDFKDNPLLSTNNSPGYMATDWWRSHPEASNEEDWEHHLLSDSEIQAVDSYTGGGYWDAAKLYDTEWDNLSDSQREYLADLHEAINKFELKRPIRINRMTNFKIFGSNVRMTEQQVRDYLKNNTVNGMLQNDNFMSFSTLSNGVNVAGSGLVIHLDVPAGKGNVAYVSGVGGNNSEREFLVNSNSVMQFDMDSIRTVGSVNPIIHINAKLVGFSKMQTIDSKNNSKFRKERG